MQRPSLLTRLKRYHERLLGSTIEHDLSAYQDLLAEIDRRQPALAAMEEGGLRRLAAELRARARAGESPDALLPEAFALVREAAFRALGLRPFGVQMIAGMVMHQCRLAEMQTGEGKTLAAVFPAFLNALGGRGVHLLTFNDYLARRDAQWMGPVYAMLGLRVAYVQQGMAAAARREAYAADVTYLTAKEAGFDHLRDSLRRGPDEAVHRPLAYCIVDEADSILIDEARVPLIIAGSADYYGDGGEGTAGLAAEMAGLVRRLQPGRHFGFDEYGRNVHLTEEGVSRAEEVLGCGNLYEGENAERLARLGHALHAGYLLKANRDYIVRNDRVEIVDEFTGRVAERRRWPEGLHEAVEAKEGLPVQPRGVILNAITLQHFIQLYPRRSGMTATAESAEAEFRQVYGLHTVVIPTEKPCVRVDHPDQVYQTRKAKTEALIAEITTVHATGRPILVGTRSVEESAELAGLLRERGVACEVLNAKRDEFEAGIIAAAGRIGAVTISTNMAGRGTDIRLGGGRADEEKAVIALGGLYVIGTNRHESLRIDRQLRGRAGRQGDPGSSRFFVSFEDDLLVKYRFHELLPPRLVLGPVGQPVRHAAVTSEVNRLQRIVEGQHAETKITLCKYTVLLEQQRRIQAQRREEVVRGNAAFDLFRERSPAKARALVAALGEEALRDACRGLALFHLDRLWSHHLEEVGHLREGIHLRRFGLQDPLFEFNKLLISWFDGLLDEYERCTVAACEAIGVSQGRPDLGSTGVKAPSATWTYLVSDNPDEEGFSLGKDMAHSVFGALAWPLALLLLIAKRHERRK